ncbi:S-adenosyl-L-methionine-dependent methyltransferase [Lipomyces tetrasporus]|uniref:Ubiquinone biosynthesis O-methyltransferase, mitochondrial n=1 Tax=Lipomyces tetrasporus TaxID=54092 RepID=A0AAD7VS14_9ASCO|nr:S-adenosyl-L-methionine-dependent methyltransferase [Lipomyces tetrasporus]KAJ8098665.1 S-adenosyl-L-methionine-dependent methyltransferase [Lipomyces tetrasporus]
MEKYLMRVVSRLKTDKRRMVARSFSVRSIDHRHNQTRSHSNAAFSAEELSHFNALASTWWDASGPSRLLHKMNPLRISFIFDTIDRYAIQSLSRETGLKVLDVGCGGGILTESLARNPRVSSVTGIDMSEDVLAIAQQHKKQDPALVFGGKLEYRLCSLLDMPVPKAASEGHEEERYDAVTLFEVLEHVPNPSGVLKAATDRVRPGGWIFVSTVNRTAAAYLTTIFMGEKILRIVPEGTHTWSKYINERELREWFNEHKTTVPGSGEHWDVVRSEGCIYVPFVGWNVGGPRDLGNYFLAARRLQ